jgi:hypothetical protein
MEPQEFIDSLSASPQHPSRSEISSLADRWLAPDRTPLIENAHRFLRDVAAPSLDNPEINEPLWLAVIEVIESWALNATDDSYLVEVADWIDENHIPLRQTVRLANRVAWATRGARTNVKSIFASGRDPANNGSMFLVAVILERGRFLFQGKNLLSDINQFRDISPRISEVPFVRAMESFALLVEGRRKDVGRAMSVIDEVWNDTSDADRVGSIRDICLHALWIAPDLPNQGEVLLKYCDSYSQSAHSLGLNPRGVIVQFRRAGALRMLERYDEAISELDEIANQIDGVSEFSRTFSEQLIRERELAKLGLNLAGLKSEFDDSRKRLETTAEKIKESERRLGEIEHQGLTRNVQIISMFTAAVAFAVGLASISSKAGSSPLSAVLISASLGVGLLGFVFIIYLITRTAEEAQRLAALRKLNWAVGLSIIALFVSFAAIAVAVFKH